MKLLEVGTVPALPRVVSHKDQTGAIPPSAADTAGNLNIGGSGLRLTHDSHDGESVDIDAYFDDIGSQTGIETRSGIPFQRDIKFLEHSHDFRLAEATGKLFNDAQVTSVLGRCAGPVEEELKPRTDVRVEKRLRTSEFSDTIVESEQRPPWVFLGGCLEMMRGI
jgi:hypothetical protein